MRTMAESELSVEQGAGNGALAVSPNESRPAFTNTLGGAVGVLIRCRHHWMLQEGRRNQTRFEGSCRFCGLQGVWRPSGRTYRCPEGGDHEVDQLITVLKAGTCYQVCPICHPELADQPRSSIEQSPTKEPPTGAAETQLEPGSAG